MTRMISAEHDLLARAMALRHQGNLAGAEALYLRGLGMSEVQGDCLHQLGILAGEAGQLPLSIDYLSRVVALRPRSIDCLRDLAESLRRAGRRPEARRALETARDVDPGNVPIRLTLGILLIDMGLAAEAEAELGAGVGIDPARDLLRFHHGISLYLLGRRREAVGSFVEALRLNPRMAEAYNNLSVALLEEGRLEDAREAAARALALDSQAVGSLVNRGTAESYLGDYDAALASFEAVLRLDPQVAMAHFGRGMVLLRRGRMAEGWPEYEWRMRIPTATALMPGVPVWQDEPLDGRRLLLVAEQGQGDTLQFARYAPLLAARGARVVLMVQPTLKRLMGTLAGVETVIGKNEAPPPVDFQIPLMSLPHRLGTDMGSIPAAIPYLAPEPGASARFDGVVAADKLNVGLVWAGAGRPDLPMASMTDRRRSLRLSLLAPLADIDGVRLISLQKGEPVSQLAEAGVPDLIDPMGEIDDFAETAALVSRLDLVISVDTSVAHLAGALGVPVWVMSRFDACWRWFDAREDSPWYPTMRLFRQRAAGDWEELIARVAAALAETARDR